MKDQAENLRNNVIKLQRQNVIQKARVITVTSGKGGVGKSSISVSLALSFTQLGKKVIIFDADFGLANVEVMLGTVPEHNLSDVIYGTCMMKDIVTETSMGVGFVSGGSGVTKLNDLSELEIRRVAASLSQLEELCDILIVDTGAGISKSVLNFVVSSPETILITTPEPGSITDSYALLKALFRNPSFDKKESRVLLLANKVASEIEGRQVYDKLSRVSKSFLGGDIDYLGMVPYDSVLEKYTRQQKIALIESPGSKGAKAISAAAEKLLSDEGTKRKASGITSFFNSFLRRG